MNFDYKKILLFNSVLIAIFFCNCQPKTSDANLTNQKNESEKQLPVRISAPEIETAEPAIAADKDGNIYVVFVEHEDKKSANVYLQKFDKNIKQIGQKVRVNTEKGNATAWFGDAPTIKIGNDKTIFIGWTAKFENAEKPSANFLNLSVSRDGGKSFDAPVKVNDDTAPSSHGMHSLEIDKNNHIFMAWLDERNIRNENHARNFASDKVIESGKIPNSGDFYFIKAYHHDSNQKPTDKKNEKPDSKAIETEIKEEKPEPNSEIFFALSKDGGKTFSKNLKISNEVCPCCKTNLAIDLNGKIYASWRQVLPGNFRHIAVASSENNGESFSDYKIVSDDQWQINACPVSGAPMFIDGKNDLKVFWYTAGSAGKAGFYTSESTDGGKTFAPRSLIYDGAIKGTPTIFAKNEQDFGVLFDGMGEIFQMNQSSNPEEKIAGELPSAIFASGNIFVAFTKNENQKNSIWLAKF